MERVPTYYSAISSWKLHETEEIRLGRGCKSQICLCRYATGDEHRKRKNCTFFIRWHWKLRYSFKTVWSQKQMKAWYYRCGSRIPHRAPSLCYKCLWKCDSKCGLEMSLELSALFDAALLHHKHINFKRFELFAINNSAKFDRPKSGISLFPCLGIRYLLK